MTLTHIFGFIGGLGAPEIILIVVVLLLFFGGRRIPELARGLGKGIREFKNASNEKPEEKKELKDPDKESSDNGKV